MEKQAHIPVLLEESLGILSLVPGDTYLDATLGEGGHALEVWHRMGEKVEIVGLDADPQAVCKVEEKFEAEGALGKFYHQNFRKIIEVATRPTKILFDLGWNRSQFEEGGKGFSFQKDEPLRMTFGEVSETGFNAFDIVNSWEAENIATILTSYGEERFAKRIAERIVEERQKGEIKTSGQLAEIVSAAVPAFYRWRKLNPATKTFQALRIAVNDELRALEEGLQGAMQVLPAGGRLAVISFHSLEDRMVKRFFKNLADKGEAKILTKKPLTASEQELENNPRSRSAKLRAVEKI